jgi:hypothetical protein
MVPLNEDGMFRLFEAPLILRTRKLKVKREKP